MIDLFIIWPFNFLMYLLNLLLFICFPSGGNDFPPFVVVFLLLLVMSFPFGGNEFPPFVVFLFFAAFLYIFSPLDTCS